MAKIKKMTVNGFRSIRSLKDLDLNPGLNVLIGANGAGKSNFIGFFKFLNAIVNERLQFSTAKSGGSSKILYNGLQTTKKFNASIFFDLNGYIFTLEPTQGDSFVFSAEQLLFNEPSIGQKMTDLGSGQAETRIFQDKSSSGIAAYVRSALKSWIVYHFHDTSEYAELKQFSDINNNIALNTNAGNLAAFLFRLKTSNPVNYNGIVNAVKMIAPFFKDFSLRPSPANQNMIQLEWFENNSDQPFNAHQLSDGTIRFICLATVLLQPNPPDTIIIDEPELGLHPFALSILGSLFRSSSANVQIIVSTQSVQLVNEFDADAIIVVNRDDNQSTFSKLNSKDLKDWLKSYDLGELWEKNVIGGRPTK